MISFDTLRAGIAGRLSPLAVSPRLIAALVAVIAFAGVIFSATLFYDADTFWHLAAGRWILQHRAVPAVDVFSYTRLGQPWHAHEWLSEVAMALAYRAGGWGAVAVLTGAAGAAAAALMSRYLGRWLWTVPQLATLALVLACVSSRLFARPHILALPVMVAWTAGLLAARDDDRRPSLWLLPVMCVWANMHGGYFIGLLLIGPLALEALLSKRDWPGRRQVVVGWGLFGLLALGAALLTPQGIGGLLFPLQVQNMTTLTGIREWLSADFSKPTTLEFALLATLFVLLSRGARVPMLRLLVLLAFLHLALQFRRHELLLAISAPLLLAPSLAAALRPGGVAGRRARDAGRALWLGRGVAAIALLALAGWRLATPVVRGDAFSAPVTALAHVPPALLKARVFNHYDFGGYLIFKGVPTFVDGRADLYGDAWMKRYFAIARGNPQAVEDMMAREKPAWTIMRQRDGFAKLMDRRPGWHRLYADKWAVIHVRDSAWPQGRSTSAPSSTAR